MKSETHRSLFNSRVRDLLIAGALLFVAIYWVRGTPPTPPPDPEPSAVESPPSPPHRVRLARPPAFDAHAYYQPIIEYNLFRPLGWTPPRPTEPYRLIGTILPRSANTPPKAIIESTTGDQTSIVSLGDKLDADTQIVDIQPKQVTLSQNGQQRMLNLNTAIYLNASAATRSPRRTIETPHRPTPRPQTAAPVRSKPTAAPPAFTAPPTETHRPAPLSEWETREGQPIRLGDARLKNPQKWGLRRR